MSLKQSLFKLQLLLDELRSDLLDFRTLNLLVVDSSHIQQLTKIKNMLIYIENALIDSIESTEFQQNYLSFQNLLSSYNSTLSSLSDDNLPNNLCVSSFIFQENKLASQLSLKQSSLSKKQQIKKSKSVRFKDNLVDYSPSPLPTSSSSQTKIQPYKDVPEVFPKDDLFQTSTSVNSQDLHNDPENGNTNVNTLSDRQIFIANQQEIVNQDTVINSLSRSVRTQRSMALSINDEISDQMVLLDDLENGVVNSNSRLVRTHSKLTRFREQVSKNGDWYTILVLVCILLLLLVVLK